ncbi:uncharacterized protein C18orf63 isoform X1 [Tachysurus fulvidraco]|uniref:uncharacterized protein C18orf63 isoform X1 n=1 Tax=Tachysurus fulvidraco TaxID=1234273 RepID=UPI001FEEBF86|nr:uncharacterized protein C18orf63 isoform X1 [Tachysurus fulvidraco]XP_047667605.1 uncharacterized protein C18orf63 isoform X1 [Tachysurus fulvidraco]XP_047667606.1 uncharacterized protein C18orf63 isoform X1 [Tachysurus fulvidraco]
MTGYSEKCLFFIPVPDLKKLYSVFLSFYNFSSHADEGELRNRQVKTCREVLRLHSDVIASPVLGPYGGIRVIMSIKYFKKGVIQAYAQSHGLQIHSPERVSPNILQLCLSYSLTARLAPNWNRAGQHLIAGKDFLSDASKRIAVVLELSVNETELCVSVEASTVRLPPVTLKDFDFPALVIERFLSNRDTVLHTKTPNNWCYILPSMKKGQVIRISRTLPPECPFQSYAELENHWNSMYGYCLPPLNMDEVVYCSMYFKPLGEKLFTYPLCCIRIQPVQCFPRVNLQGALTAFISDARSLMENVCGFTAQMTSKPCYYTTNLSRPGLQYSGALPATLTSQSSSRLVLTQLPNVFPPEMVPIQQLKSFQRCLSQPVGHCNIRHPATANGHGIPQISNPVLQSSHYHGAETCQFPSSLTSLPSFSSSSSVSANCPLLSNTQPATQRPKLVPVFTNKSLSCHVNITKILAEKKKQQKEEVTQCASRVAINRPSCSLSSSATSLHRVSLPSDRKRDRNACTTTLTQPLVQTQPASVSEIKITGGEAFVSHPKKVRVIQEVDVVKYARSNQLAKINAATLQAWLKGQGVTVRSKDKKEDLMSKVMQCLNEP